MKKPAAILGSAFFLVLAPGTVAGYIPWLISHWRMQPPLLGLSAVRVMGMLLIAAGTPALLDSFDRFARQGLGTPAPVLPTQHLVVTGLYRYVRNPMYVGVASIISGQGLLFGNVRMLAYGLLVWCCFHVFVVGYEEPTLRRSFGAEYERFCQNVSRWIPRIRPWRDGEQT
jgi:protein-S-isoprenylcysteine O-methyltransferase Ste14